jgi:hypothetical protein
MNEGQSRQAARAPVRSPVSGLMRGAIDIHVHFGPDPRVERRAGAIETARRALELGMRGLVLKSHEYPTQPVAATVSEVVPGITLVGGVCLDDEVGGLNAHAVEATARMGGRVVWLPTFNAAAYRSFLGNTGGVTVLDDNGRLLDSVHDVLRVIKEYDLVLATGHVSRDEIFAVLEAANSLDIRRVVATHISSLNRWYGIAVEDMVRMAQAGAMLEHCVLAMMPGRRSIPASELAEMIRTAGVESAILSTDFGQWNNPIPPEGLRMGIAMLLQAGMKAEELELMVKGNPARLLGLDEDKELKEE